MKPLAPALALLLAVPVASHAQDPLLAGEVCRFVAFAPAAGTTWTAVVDGGPLAAADVAFVAPDPLQWVVDNPVSVTLTCTLHVGFFVNHTSPAAASASATGDGVAVLLPTLLGVDVPDHDDIITVCTRASVTDRDGQTYDRYWDAQREEFTNDPSATCGPVACTLEFPPRGEGACGPSAFDVIDHLVGEVPPWGPIDAAVCPVLKELYPPEGDVPGVWDCPPYDT